MKQTKWMPYLLALSLLPTSQSYANTIHTQTIQTEVYDRYLSLGGTVIPFKEVSITAQMAGQVNFIAGVEGDRFEAGTLLISIDDDILRAQRQAAIAQWKQASYSLQNAHTQYNKELWSPQTEQTMTGMAIPGLVDQMFTKPLSDSMGIGDSDVDRRANLAAAQTRVQEAKAMMQQIKAKIEEIDVHLMDTKSTAAFDGVIVKKMVEAGDTVQPGQPLLTFAKSNHLSIEVQIPVNLMNGIKKGNIYQARLANKMPVNVRAVQIFPVANDQQHTVTVKFDLPLGTPAAPGMYAEVAIENASSQNLTYPTVPKQAVVKRGSLPSVFLLNPQTKRVEMRIVRLGKATHNNRYTILSGVSAGEVLITNPPSHISSGQKLERGNLVAVTP